MADATDRPPRTRPGRSELPAGVWRRYEGDYYQLIGVDQHTEREELQAPGPFCMRSTPVRVPALGARSSLLGCLGYELSVVGAGVGLAPPLLA